MTPRDFRSHPFGSILKNNESEVVAENIMIILWRTGNEWRKLTWDEYKTERQMDGNFTEKERKYFDAVVDYCSSETMAKKFCPDW